MNVPKDQGLFFSVFFVICIAAVLALWAALPVYHHGEFESEEAEETELLALDPAVTPEERIHRMEQALGLASAAIEQLEPSEEKAGKPAPEKKK